MFLPACKANFSEGDNQVEDEERGPRALFRLDVVAINEHVEEWLENVKPKC